MSTWDARRILESAMAPDEELRVHEAASTLGVLESATGPFQADGSVLVHIIRPCRGKGRGSHVYEADMLQREATKFKGWPMFIDHESPEAQRRSGGLPPSISRLGGEVLESWWDGDVPPEGRFGKGAVAARVTPSPWMRDVIKALPRQVQTSVNTFATGVKARRNGGQVENVVEGFADDGSVDWVTKAGAGGKIVQIMESYFDGEGGDHDPDIADWLRKHRPAVVEALIKTPEKPDTGDQEDDVDAKTLLEAFGKLDDDGRETVAEAVLNSDAGGTKIAEAVDERLKQVLPPAMEAAGEEVERAALAKVDERLGRGDLMTAAKAKLDEAKLVEWARNDAWARVSEQEFKPVEPDSEGKNGKTATEVMEAAVTVEVERVTKLQEAAGVKPEDAKPRVTTVTGNGGGGGDEERERVRESESLAAPDEWAHDLQEAGIDPFEAYGIPKPKADEPATTKADGE